jgi:hypothetical protein
MKYVGYDRGGRVIISWVAILYMNASLLTGLLNQSRNKSPLGSSQLLVLKMFLVRVGISIILAFRETRNIDISE